MKAAASGRKEYEVFEEAVRDYIGWRIVERVGARAGLSESEAMQIAAEELAAFRGGEESTPVIRS